MKYDMHMHSCLSDGACTPEELVRKYKSEGYELIALTDHDTIDGLADALACGMAEGLNVIPGIEFSTRNENGVEMHILGYDFDIGNARLRARLEEIRANRRERNAKLIAYFNEQGCDITYEDLMAGKTGDYIGKPDFGRAMARKGYIEKPRDIFAPGGILDSPGAKAIKKVKVDTHEAIALVNEAGGYAVLAHPIQIKDIGMPGTEEWFAELEKLVKELDANGLSGIECYHRDHTPEQCERFKELAEKYDLLVTGGSDYHGDDME